MSVPGETSGRQRAYSRAAGALGSWTKTQPPTARERRPGVLGIVGVARDIANGVRIVAPIGGVTAQEFQGETGAIEAV
jgi:hypothetical protein